MLERTRALFKLKSHERCPGEEYCENDPRGYINKRAGATLETHCNKDCPLFFTNSVSVPPQFAGWLEAASMLRERNKLGLALNDKHLPSWAITAYKLGERAYDLAEAGHTEEQQNPDGDNDMDISKGGDSDAFARIEKELR